MSLATDMPNRISACCMLTPIAKPTTPVRPPVSAATSNPRFQRRQLIPGRVGSSLIKKRSQSQLSPNPHLDEIAVIGSEHQAVVGSDAIMLDLRINQGRAA